LTRIEGGTLRAASSLSIPAGSIVEFDGGVLDVTAGSLTVAGLRNTMPVNQAGTVNLVGGATLNLNLTGERTELSGGVTGTRALTVSGVGTQQFSATVSINGPVAVTGGELILKSSSNSFTGAVTATGPSAILTAGADHSFGAAGNLITLANGATLRNGSS